MPEAEQWLRDIWHYNCDAQFDAEWFLIQERCFMLTRRWTWVPPVPMTWEQLDDKERSAILYLFQEWDYGGLE